MCSIAKEFTKIFHMVSNIYIIGMSKNCFPNLQKNLSYLIDFKKKSNFHINICIIDSDSTDGTKDYCNDLFKKSKLDNFIEIDDLEIDYQSRIERLSICRNRGIEFIKDQNQKNLIYLPMDMDLDLFKYTTIEAFDEIISSFIDNKNMDGMFPFSKPYYYDIFALRKKGWVNGNNLLISRNMKDRFKFFTFIFNYIYIFKNQKHINKFPQRIIEVDSAFGGMGMYKINSNNQNQIKYDTSKENVDFYSEHLYFNNYFKNLYINKDWNISSPIEYTFFNSYNFYEKIIYILKTLKNDLKNFNK